MRKIKAVIFDMDGILVDSEAVSRDCLIKCAERQSLSFEKSYYERFLGINDEETVRIMNERYKDEEAVKRILDDFTVMIKEEYRNGNIRLKPGCKEIIDFLKSEGIPYALATGSSYPYVEMDFLSNGYDTVPFDHIVAGDQISHSKPDPEIFLKAAASMDIDIRDCLIIEDSPKGIEAACRSGASSCYIPDLVKSSELIEKADYHAEDLLEAIGLIRSLYH